MHLSSSKLLTCSDTPPLSRPFGQCYRSTAKGTTALFCAGGLNGEVEQRHNKQKTATGKGQERLLTIQHFNWEIFSGSVFTDECVLLSRTSVCVLFLSTVWSQSWVWTSESFSTFAYDQDHIGVIHNNDGLLVLLWIEYPCMQLKTVNA